MRGINKALAGTLPVIMMSATQAHAFNYDSSNYAVYEVANTNGTKTLYIVPTVVPWVIGGPRATVILQYPKTPSIGSTGYAATLYGNGTLNTFSAISATAANMPGLNATLSTYQLFSGDFDGDGRLDFLLRGIGANNSVVLTSDANGLNPQTYYNFGTAFGSEQIALAVFDSDKNGRTDIIVTDHGNITSYLSNGSSFTTSGPSAIVDNFPRLASYQIGGGENDSVFQQWAAKFHINILGADAERREQQTGIRIADVVNGIKGSSRIASRVFQYVNLNESPFSSADAWMPTWTDKINSMNWWTYINGTSGPTAASHWNPAWGVTNMTSASPVDPATGLGPYAWGAKFVNDLFHLGTYAGTSPAPTLDGFFLDNVFWQSWTNADWNRDGTTDISSDATVSNNFRTGEKQFFDEMAVVYPTGVQIGNATRDSSSTPFTPLIGVMSGALIEAAIGSSAALDTYQGSLGMQTSYQLNASSIKSPYYLIFGHQNVSANGTDQIWNAANNTYTASPAYQGMRYGITACLMGNAYYGSSRNSNYSPTELNWFDEFDGGGLGVGYLGQPLANAAGAVQTAAWQNGIWKREFQNGIVLWSPHSTSNPQPATVSLSGLGNLKRLTGSQAPTVNSGAVVTNGNITLQDRDGIILLRY